MHALDALDALEARGGGIDGTSYLGCTCSAPSLCSVIIIVAWLVLLTVKTPLINSAVEVKFSVN